MAKIKGINLGTYSEIIGVSPAIDKIIVHGGTFHADDVMCVAIARTINPRCKVERSFAQDFKEEPGVIVADVGRGKYDHHQEDAALRPDGRKHAGCGLVFEDFWSLICQHQEFYASFKKKYIIPIEDADNGYERNPLSALISSFNPEWDSEENIEDCFMQAVDVLQKLIAREVNAVEAAKRAESIVDNALEHMEDGIVILPCYTPWDRRVIEISPEARYVIHPSNRGGYAVWRVPVAVGSFEPRVLFPDTMTGESAGCSFMHPARFTASFDSVEQAVAALKG